MRSLLYCESGRTLEQAMRRGGGVSFSEDFQKSSGHNPVQPALGEPVSAEELDKMWPSIQTILWFCEIRRSTLKFLSQRWTLPKEAAVDNGLAGWCSLLHTALCSGMLGACLLSRELLDHAFSQSMFVFCSQCCCQWIANITTFSRQQSGEDHENVFMFTGRETVFRGLSSELGLCLLHQCMNITSLICKEKQAALVFCQLLLTSGFFSTCL